MSELSSTAKSEIGPVLLITPTYPPVVGGSEVEAQQIAAALGARRYRVEVLTMGGGPMPPVPTFLDPNGTRVYVSARQWPEKLRGYLYGLATGVHLLRHPRRYKCVYFLMTGFQLLIALPVARLLRLPIVMKFSGPNTILPLSKSALGRCELKMLAAWACRILVLNDAMKQEARSVGLPEHLLDWMPNPVDTDRFRPAEPEQRRVLRARFGIAPEQVVILFVGRLAPEKELPVLLSAFHIVANSNPHARLVLIGNGPERSPTEELVRSLNLEPRVTFAGMQPHSSVSDWLRAADVFTLVSSLEGFSCSLVEAMSTGLPSVVSDISANLQLIEAGSEGFITRLRDVGDLATALLRLVNNAAEREQMGHSARQKVLTRYSIATVTDQYESLIRSLVR
ncbi:MAG: glycosyltransferase family 4 protein [Acidobacteriaceae bacterium]|nr:glycosyltransferase family 4 protein [Acidobacteriaceae bacterium]